MSTVDVSPVREPYRVVVWGTGRMGRVAISTVAARSDFDLVGARVYGADKNGVDAGELAGIPALGVTATSDSEEALRVDADCILHLARDFGRYDAVEEIVPLLRAGRNVITVHAFQFEHAMAATSSPRTRPSASGKRARTAAPPSTRRAYTPR